MTPIVLMLLLVALLMLVNLGAHVRLRRAFGAQMASEEVRTDLIEIRSLSRSLQRDALNLIEDNDPAELAVLHGKVRSRSAEMQAWLDRLGRAPTFARAADRTPYFATQSIVLDRLTLTALLATRGERARALATFRQEVRPHEREASRIADAMIVSQNRDVETLQRRTAMADRQEVVLVTLAGVVLFTVAAVATVLIVRRSVLAPLLDIGRAMTLVAAGDTQDETPHVGRADEIGDMARAIEVFRASVRDREALREREVERQAREAEQTLERERARHRDEEAVATRTAAITRSAQALEWQLGEVLRSMRASSAQLATTSRDLAQHSSAAGTGLGDVAGAVARALDGATDIATATARFTDAIDAASERTRRSAELGAGAAAQSLVVAAKMARVQDATINIGTVVSLIAGIAKQTSLLALNASIEAARAGDAGRGFAVVAGEVKQLAGQTAKSTDNIACQIAEMQLAARDAGGSLDQIRAMIGDIAHETQALADGIGEQAVSARVINRNLSGAAADLNLIEDRVNDVAGVASGVDALARHVNGDAGLLEHSAAMIDRALSTFFAELTKVRAAAEAGRGIAS